MEIMIVVFSFIQIFTFVKICMTLSSKKNGYWLSLSGLATVAKCFFESSHNMMIGIVLVLMGTGLLLFSKK